MASVFLSMWLALSFQFGMRQAESAGIVSPPLSLNVTLNATAIFHCTTEGGPLYWIVNNSDRPNEWGDGVDYDTTQSGIRQTSTLSIIATELRNRSTIKCAVFDIQSANALLLIQGLLEAPSAIVVNTNYTAIFLNWKAPYSLNIIPTEPDISHFVVSIENTNNGDYFTVNTSETMYAFRKQSHAVACAVFTFQIAAVNSVGTGENSAPVNGSFTKPPTLEISGSSPNDRYSITFACNASCMSNFVIWLANDTLLDDVSYRKTSNRNSVCYEADDVYVETLQLPLIDVHLGHPYSFSCAAIFLCSREEENRNCAPRMCFSIEHNKIDPQIFEGLHLTVFTTMAEEIHSTSVHYSTNSAETKKIVITEADNPSTLKSLIVGMGTAIAILMLTVMFMLIAIILICINWKRKKNISKALIPSQVQVIYDEPKVALKTHSTPDLMQSCPAYDVTGRCTFWAS